MVNESYAANIGKEVTDAATIHYEIEVYDVSTSLFCPLLYTRNKILIKCF